MLTSNVVGSISAFHNYLETFCHKSLSSNIITIIIIIIIIILQALTFTLIFMSLVGFLFPRYAAVRYHRSDAYLPDQLVRGTLTLTLVRYLEFPGQMLQAALGCLNCRGRWRAGGGGPIVTQPICSAALDTGVCPLNKPISRLSPNSVTGR